MSKATQTVTIEQFMKAEVWTCSCLNSLDGGNCIKRRRVARRGGKQNKSLCDHLCESIKKDLLNSHGKNITPEFISKFIKYNHICLHTKEIGSVMKTLWEMVDSCRSYNYPVTDITTILFGLKSMNTDYAYVFDWFYNRSCISYITKYINHHKNISAETAIKIFSCEEISKTRQYCQTDITIFDTLLDNTEMTVEVVKLLPTRNLIVKYLDTETMKPDNELVKTLCGVKLSSEWCQFLQSKDIKYDNELLSAVLQGYAKCGSVRRTITRPIRGPRRRVGQKKKPTKNTKYDPSHDQNYVDLLKYILDQRIVPNKDNFDSIYSCIDPSDYYRRHNATVGTLQMVKPPELVHVIVDMFFKYGYTPTYKDLITTVRWQVPMKHPMRFGLDTRTRVDVYEAFQVYNVPIPKDYVFNLGQESQKDMDLMNLCTKPRGSLKDLKKKLIDTKPTSKHVNTLCKRIGISDKLNKIKTLSAAGAQITLDGLYGHIQHGTDTDKFVFEQFLKLYKKEREELNNYRKNDETYEGMIVTLEEEIAGLHIEVADEKDSIKEDSEDVADAKDDGTEEEVDESVECTDVLDEDLQEDDEIDESVEGTEEEVEDKSECAEDIPKVIKITENSASTSDGPPKSKRKKYKPTQLMIDTFKIDNKKNLSFYDIRKFLTNEISSKKWIHPQDPKIFRFPKEISDKLEIDADGYISIGDLNNVVTRLM